MSGRIEICSSPDVGQHKFAKNEKFVVKEAGVDLGKDISNLPSKTISFTKVTSLSGVNTPFSTTVTVSKEG